MQPENFVRSAPGLIASDEEFLIVFRALLTSLKKAAQEGKAVVFFPENFILPDEEINGDNFVFEPTESDIEISEALRLLGVSLYHLASGKSEFTHESFILDGYRRPLNSSLWPIISALLKNEVKGLEKVEEMLNAINPEDLAENIQPLLPNTPITSPKVKLADDIIRELAGQQIKVIGHEGVANFWGIAIPQNVEIRYNEATLRESIEANRNGEQWALTYYTGQSIRQMREKIGKDKNHQPCFYHGSNDWYLNNNQSSWASKNLEAGYYLVNFNGKFASQNWEAQGRLIAEMGPAFERCHEFVVSEGVFSNFAVHNGERLLENWYHWGKELTSGGFRVDVGAFDPDGFVVRGYSPDGTYDLLRVVVARKFDA